MKMKRIFTLISAIVACVLCIILSNLICEAKTVLCLNKCGTVLDVFMSNDKNIYVLCEYNNNYKVVSIDENLNTNDKLLDINSNNNTYAYANNTFYFFSKDIETDENIMPYTLIDSYNFSTDIQRKRLINYADPLIIGTYALDSDMNYYMISNKSVEVYTANYKYLKTIPFESTPINLTNTADGRMIYITTKNGLTIIENNTEYNFNIYCNKIFPIDDKYFSTDNGAVYCFDNGNVYEIYSDFDSIHSLAVIDGKVFGIKSGNLVVVNNGEEFSVEEIDSNAYICSIGDKCLCITQNGDGLDIENFTAEETDRPPQIVDSSSTVSSESIPQIFTSDTYNVNSTNNTISGIAPGSTAAAVRDNISGGTCKFYDSKGNLKTSGKVGTGNVIENADTGERFTVIMYGELSGEGNINSSDKNILVNYLLKKQNLEGIYLQAADVNGDSQVNLKDYAALDSYLKGEYNINQKR